MTEQQTPPRKRVYGRKTGRPLRRERTTVLDEILPVLQLDSALLKECGDLSAASLFSVPCSACWFEIGFGSGEHLAALMDRHPDFGFIGAEPFVNGMSAFLKSIKDRPQERVRVHMDDAMMIANSLADASLDGIYILNPDPWPKTRHHKRRMVRPETLECFARILKPGGRLVMSTDVPDLAEWMVTHTARHPAFEWDAEKSDDWRFPPPDWISTKYEQKGARGADQMSYLLFHRKS